MLISTEKLITHEVGDVIDLQINHIMDNSVELDFDPDGKIRGFGIASTGIRLETGKAIMRIKVETLTGTGKVITGQVIGMGLLGEEIRMDQEAIKAETGLFYLGLVTTVTKTSTTQHEAYLIPVKNNKSTWVVVGTLGRCQRE